MTLHQKISAPPFFLASVMNATEAAHAAHAGADLIDCKDPQTGALGALAIETIAQIRARVPQQHLVSATIGDLVPEPDIVVPMAEAWATSGADLLKIGFFPGGNAQATIAALGESEAGLPPLVGLLFADQTPDFSLIEDMARAGFVGVMLDTADKKAGGLADVQNADQLRLFLHTARAHGLFAGLAGSLRARHISPLINLGPDIIGFRGALCGNHDRSGTLETAAVAHIRGLIPRRPAGACRALIEGAIPAQ